MKVSLNKRPLILKELVNVAGVEGGGSEIQGGCGWQRSLWRKPMIEMLWNGRSLHSRSRAGGKGSEVRWDPLGAPSSGSSAQISRQA